VVLKIWVQLAISIALFNNSSILSILDSIFYQFEARNISQLLKRMRFINFSIYSKHLNIAIKEVFLLKNSVNLS